jgi:uncharacterized protein (TIRG00374 family)
MESQKSSYTKIIFFVIIIIFFYTGILLAFDLEKIILTLNQINFLHYLAIYPITGLTLLVQGWRFKITLEKLGITLGFKQSFLVYAAGLSMSITPGGAGSIIKSHILKLKTGKSFSYTSPIIIYEKWLELVAIVSIIGIFLIWVNIFESLIVFVIGIFLSSITFFAFKNSLGVIWLNKITSRLKFLQNYMIDIKEFKNTTIELTKLSTLSQLLSITFLSKILPMIAVFLIFNLVDYKLDIFTTTQIYFTSLVAGILTFIPGGIIVTEAGLLGLSIKFGIDFGTAALLVLLIRLLTFWVPTFVGIISLKFISTKSNIM